MHQLHSSQTLRVLFFGRDDSSPWKHSLICDKISFVVLHISSNFKDTLNASSTHWLCCSWEWDCWESRQSSTESYNFFKPASFWPIDEDCHVFDLIVMSSTCICSSILKIRGWDLKGKMRSRGQANWTEMKRNHFTFLRKNNLSKIWKKKWSCCLSHPMYIWKSNRA